MSGPITYLQDNTRAELCKKRSTGSTEYCPSFNVAGSSFYTLVHAYKPHRSGSVSFTGSNLISVTNTTEQEPEMSQCQQKGLYYDISILKISINSSTQLTRGKFIKLNWKCSLKIFFHKNIFHCRCNWKQTWKSCKLPWENWWHTGSSQSYSINCGWNWCHPSGNQRYVCW